MITASRPDRAPDSRAALLPAPDPSMHEVGADPSGHRAVRQLRLLEHFGLRPDSRVLEIGCGVGRLAYELADVLTQGSYAGIDISSSAIAWLDEHYRPALDNFRFDLLDISNPRYRPNGTVSGTTVRLPYDDAQFDLACSFSVFMHIQLPEIERYLAELQRVLVAGGRAVVTLLTILPSDERPTNQGKPFISLGGGVYTNKPRKPGFGMAYDISVFQDTVRRAGLLVDEHVEGYWHGRLTMGTFPASGPDLFVLRRP